MYSVEGVASCLMAEANKIYGLKYKLSDPVNAVSPKSSNPVTNASILHVDSMLPNENAYTSSVSRQCRGDVPSPCA